MPRDLELAEPRDLILGPALAAHEIDVELADVLGLGSVAGELPGGDRAQHADPDLPDQDGQRERDHDLPPRHALTVRRGRHAAARRFGRWRSRGRAGSVPQSGGAPMP
jgi:hypothetical protein